MSFHSSLISSHWTGGRKRIEIEKWNISIKRRRIILCHTIHTMEFPSPLPTTYVCWLHFILYLILAWTLTAGTFNKSRDNEKGRRCDPSWWFYAVIVKDPCQDCLVAYCVGRNIGATCRDARDASRMCSNEMECKAWPESLRTLSNKRNTSHIWWHNAICQRTLPLHTWWRAPDPLSHTPDPHIHNPDYVEFNQTSNYFVKIRRPNKKA